MLLNWFRIKDEELKAELPKIPCQPIGYRDAKALLERLGGKVAPDSWKGGIEGLDDYRLGGEFAEDCDTCQAK